LPADRLVAVAAMPETVARHWGSAGAISGSPQMKSLKK
jgi:hypothetical protein